MFYDVKLMIADKMTSMGGVNSTSTTTTTTTTTTNTTTTTWVSCEAYDEAEAWVLPRFPGGVRLMGTARRVILWLCGWMMKRH